MKKNKSKNKDKLQKQYESVCNDYIKRFVKKQDCEFDGWVGDTVGGVASFIEQYFFNFSDIVCDINAKCPKGMIFKWQDDSLNHKDYINYFAYSKGLRLDNKEKKK